MASVALHQNSRSRLRLSVEIRVVSSQLIMHQEKCWEIIIDCEAVTKTTMTTIYCNWLGAVDIGYNQIIIILQPLKCIYYQCKFPSDYSSYN